MKNIIYIFLLISFFSFSQEEKRLALVIGNANYGKGELKNPVNDARLIAQTLESQDFDVILATNLEDQRSFLNTIREFGNRRAEYDVGFVYYAGHGVQIAGENYLLPTKEIYESKNDIEDYAVNVAKIMKYLTSMTNQVNILILDACRDNPFEQNWNTTRSLKGEGLAKMPPPTGSLIAFSTDSGNTAADGDGENSIYCKSLVKNMLLKNTTLDQVFRNVRTDVLKASNNMQRPIESSQLTGQAFYLMKSDYSDEINDIENLITKKKYTQALSLVSGIIEKSEDLYLLFLRAQINYITSNYNEAIDDLILFNKSESSNTRVNKLLADSYFLTEKKEKAIDYYNEVIKVDSTNYNLFLLRSFLYRDLNDKKNELLNLHKALDLKPNNAYLHFYLSIIDSTTKTKSLKKSMSLIDLKKIYRRSPKDSIIGTRLYSLCINNLRKHYLYDVKDYNQGLEVVNEYVRKFPNNADSWYQRSEFHYWNIIDKGETSRMQITNLNKTTFLEDVKKSIELDGTKVEHYKSLSKWFILNKDYTNATNTLEKMILIDSTYLDAIYDLKRVAYSTKNYKKFFELINSNSRELDMGDYNLIVVASQAWAQNLFSLFITENEVQQEGSYSEDSIQFSYDLLKNIPHYIKRADSLLLKKISSPDILDKKLDDLADDDEWIVNNNLYVHINWLSSLNDFILRNIYENNDKLVAELKNNFISEIDRLKNKFPNNALILNVENSYLTNQFRLEKDLNIFKELEIKYKNIEENFPEYLTTVQFRIYDLNYEAYKFTNNKLYLSKGLIALNKILDYLDGNVSTIYLNYKIDLLVLMNNFDEIQNVCDLWQKYEPNNPQINYYRSYINYNNGDYLNSLLEINTTISKITSTDERVRLARNDWKNHEIFLNFYEEDISVTRKYAHPLYIIKGMILKKLNLNKDECIDYNLSLEIIKSLIEQEPESEKNNLIEFKNKTEKLISENCNSE